MPRKITLNIGRGGSTGGGSNAPTMLLGAAIASTSDSAWTTREAQVGPLRVRRSYDPGFNTNFMSGVAAIDVGKRASWLSVKPGIAATANGSMDSAITTFANSIPTNHPLMLTWQHEPENDGVAATTWVTGFRRFYSIVKNIRPNVLIGPVLMAWTFNPGSGRNPQDWNVGGANCDFYGVDEYNDYHFPAAGNGNKWVTQPSSTVTAFQSYIDAIGVPGAFGEIASAEDQTGIGPQRKIDWTNTSINWGHTHGWLAYCWFDIFKSGDTAVDMMLDSSPEFLAYWKAQADIHTATTFTP